MSSSNGMIMNKRNWQMLMVYITLLAVQCIFIVLKAEGPLGRISWWTASVPAMIAAIICVVAFFDIKING